MHSPLTGTAAITGAANGIGRGVALAFVEAGCQKMLLGDIDTAGLEATKDLLLDASPGIDVDTTFLDVSDEAYVEAFIERCVARFGRIDYALNIAGICPVRTPIVDLDVATYDKVFNVNLYGIRQMLNQSPDSTGIRGSIISTSSMAGLNGSPGVSPYCSTKFGIIGLVKTDAIDYGPQGVRLNVVCPGFTDTPALHAISTAEQRLTLSKAIPLQRLGTAGDVGRTFAFLCSDAASYVHGAVYLCDGGAMVSR